MENRVKEGLGNVRYVLDFYMTISTLPDSPPQAKQAKGFIDSLLAALEKPGEDEKLILTALKVGKTGDDAIRRLGKFPKDEERLFYKAEDALSRLVLAAKLTDEERVKIAQWALDFAIFRIKNRPTLTRRVCGFPLWNPDNLNGDTEKYCGYCGGTKAEHGKVRT